MNAAAYWLIPAILVLALAGVALLVRAWMGSSRERAAQAGSRLRKFAADLARLESAARDFSPDDGGPYVQPASELAGALDSLRRQIQQHTGRYTAVRQAMRRAEPRSLQAVVGAPFAWRAIRRQVSELEGQSEELAELLAAAGQTLAALQRMGWSVAEKARDFDDRLEQASQIAQALHAARVQGPAFQEAIRAGTRLRHVTQEVPEYFFTAEPEAVLGQAEKATIVRVDSLLGEHRAALDELCTALQGWKRQYDEANGYLGAIGKAVDDLRRTAFNPPAGLQLDRAEMRLHQMEQAAAELRNRMAEPDAEELRTLLQETRTTARTAQADVQQIDTARQQLAEMQTSIRELNARLHATGSAMAVPERKERYPLAWDCARPALAVLHEKLAAVGEPAAERLPGQVAKDLAAVRSLTAAADELGQTVSAAVECYGRLVPLIEQVDLKANAERYANARRLALLVPAYAAENWSRQDAAAAFPQDVVQFMRQVETVVPPDPGAPLLESKLAGLLQTAETTAAQYQALVERAERIGSRLAEMEGHETTADQKLNLVVSLFNQVDTLAQTNPVLAQVAGRTDTERLWQEGQRLADDLFKEDRRRQGSLEKKAQKVDGFYQRVEAAANTWLNKVQSEVIARRDELTGKLDRLSQIAPLEDPMLVNAERLLADELPEPAIKGVTVALPQLMSEMKRHNDVLLRLNSVTEAVETEVESEVVAAYEAGVQQRQASIERLEVAHRQLSGEHAWPPTSQNLDAEIQAFEEVEGRWEGLRAGPLRANRLILLLGEITRGYQAVQEQIERKLERAEAERDRIAALEQSIDEAAQMWQAQSGQHRDPEAQEAIGQLLAEVRGQIELLQQQVSQGRKTHPQVEQELRALAKQINNAQIPLAGGLVDIGGE